MAVLAGAKLTRNRKLSNIDAMFNREKRGNIVPSSDMTKKLTIKLCFPAA